MKKKRVKKKRVKKHPKEESKKESQKTKGKKNSEKTKRVGGGVLGSLSKYVSKHIGNAYDTTKHFVKKKFRSKNTTNIYNKSLYPR